jgi:hypothetical protein
MPIAHIENEWSATDSLLLMPAFATHPALLTDFNAIAAPKNGERSFTIS